MMGKFVEDEIVRTAEISPCDRFQAGPDGGPPVNYRALSLHQPWATLIRAGLKSIESRAWGTNYRGPLLVHAAKKRDEDTEPMLRKAHSILCPEGIPPLGCVFPFGAAVAVASLVDCIRCTGAEAFPPREHEFGDLSPGRYAWKLAAVRPLPRPIPWRGMQGLWSAPPGLCRLVSEMMEAAA